MKYLLLSIAVGCSSDVSIIKTYDDQQDTYQNQIIDTTDSTSDDAHSIEGTSGYLHFYLRQVACPACVGESQELNVQMNLKLHEPITDSHTLWVPEQGECSNTFQYITPSINPISLGNTLNVQSIHPLSLTESTLGSYYTSLYETQYDRNYNYAISTSNTVLFNFQSIYGFDTIEPYSMLYVDPSYAFQAPIPRTGATFWWTPYGDPNQIFNVTIATYSPDGSQFLGYATCSGADSGQLTIPAQYLSQFPGGSLAAIHLTRHKIILEPSEFLNSYIETHMEWEVVGTGYLQ